jgi:DNA-directed RNA polymerase specialized sigma24 family protein
MKRLLCAGSQQVEHLMNNHIKFCRLQLRTGVRSIAFPHSPCRFLSSGRQFRQCQLGRLDWLNMSESRPKPESRERRVFNTTHWSVVLVAGEGNSDAARKALETLCKAYWYPIYIYVRRKGHGADEAQDLTQEFFTQLIAKDHVSLADRNKGKFRTFLLAMLDYFLAREWSRVHRQKRGGKFMFISLDQLAPEERYRLEPADNNTPERQFLRQWALTVLKHAMNALEKECETNGKAQLFREANGLLSGEGDIGAYASLSQRLGMTEGAIRVAVHRLRKRYGEILRDQIADTVGDPGKVDEEMSCLLAVLRQ